VLSLTVDLATGVCTPHDPPPFSHPGQLVTAGYPAARLPDGRVVSTGITHFGWVVPAVGRRFRDVQQYVQVLEPPEPGSPNEAGLQFSQERR
jgi:hypothetical protein